MQEEEQPFINSLMVKEEQTSTDITKPLHTSIKKDEELSYFTIEEMKDKLARVPPNKHGMLFQFLWRTGVRVTECINVRKRDIDFDNSEIMIRWLKNRKYNYRKIAMHSSLKMPLWSYTAKLNSEDRLFSYSRQYVDQLCKRYGFAHAHKIRHSFAVNFLRQSESALALAELKEILGHNRIETTMRYLKVVPYNQKTALARIRFD